MYIAFLAVAASQIWDLAEGKSNTMELAETIDNSDLEAFGFTDDFIFEIWGAITGKEISINQFRKLVSRITCISGSF